MDIVDHFPGCYWAVSLLTHVILYIFQIQHPLSIVHSNLSFCLNAYKKVTNKNFTETFQVKSDDIKEMCYPLTEIQK